MRTTAFACLLGTVVAVAGCSSSGTPSTTKPSEHHTAASAGAPGSPSASASSCSLAPKPDVIEWNRAPGATDEAEEISAINLALCKYNYDQSLLAQTTPSGTGYCTIVASVAANPGYNVNANPAPKPTKGILAETGESC